MDKRTVQQPKAQQFESTGFQDPQEAAETSGSYYYSYDGKLEGRKQNGHRKEGREKGEKWE